MEDLVGVRVAYPAERPRIRQRSLERVILRDESASELFERRIQDFQTAGVVGHNSRVAREHGQRGATLRAGLSERQQAGVEREIDQGRALGLGGPSRKPVEPAGDHQMHHQPQIALESQRNALPHTLDADHTTTAQS